MKVYIPLRDSCHERTYDIYDSFLYEIVELSGNQKLITLIDDVLNLEENSKPLISSLDFEVIRGNKNDNTEPEIVTELNKKHPFFHNEWTSEYLILKAVLKEGNVENENSTYIINDILNRLNLLVNLSYSTSIDFLPGVIYSHSNVYIGKSEIILSTNMDAYEHSRIMNWPKIKNVKLTDTINWFNKFEIHPDFQSKNDLHRAINAFSHLFDNLKLDGSAQLFWVMLGIESLLVEGNQNITSQFKEKSILILGKPKEYSKRLSKLYDYRSKLVHGSSDIFPRHYSDYESFEREYYKNLDFAVSILLALMRELIEKQKCNFEFELKLKE
jgi:hypothetical protein